MKTENKFSPNDTDNHTTAQGEREGVSTRVYNVRTCPACAHELFGMPGGRDAHCPNCGYKDPCCSD